MLSARTHHLLIMWLVRLCLLLPIAARGFTSTQALPRGRAPLMARPVAEAATAGRRSSSTATGGDAALAPNLRRAVAMSGGAGGDGPSYVLVTGGAG